MASTFHSLALALLDADEADSLEESVVALCQYKDDYEVDDLAHLLTVLLALTARLGEQTPRYVAEALFNEAPTDDEWESFA